ncbi:hypothetical protein Ahy_A02g006410 [Arachis hypogaea]|uniref:Uncharacterized protein n=1 Tax=Arachis hypogaea TaxID=3818 RepID=A0A445E9Q3_ARAHY|nr:hypothetical protein Ahy_A02g006410 [Arachis hypogaea]
MGISYSYLKISRKISVFPLTTLRVMKKVHEEVRNLEHHYLCQKKLTNEKCTIYGYEIPAKTIVYINAWAIIHRDSETFF